MTFKNWRNRIQPYTYDPKPHELFSVKKDRRRRRSSSSSIISDSASLSTSTAAAVPLPPKNSSNGYGLFTRFKQRIMMTFGSTTPTITDEENPLVFHKSERLILLEEDRRDNCTKEVEAMDADSAVSLGKFSAFLLAHLGFLVFTNAKIESCEHLKYLGLLLFCAIAFEAILGYLAVLRTGNAMWKHVRVGEEVAELKLLDFEKKINPIGNL